jgi:hypothetical protein
MTGEELEQILATCGSRHITPTEMGSKGENAAWGREICAELLLHRAILLRLVALLDQQVSASAKPAPKNRLDEQR